MKQCCCALWLFCCVDGELLCSVFREAAYCLIENKPVLSILKVYEV